MSVSSLISFIFPSWIIAVCWNLNPNEMIKWTRLLVFFRWRNYHGKPTSNSAVSWMSWCHCLKPDVSELLYHATGYLVFILQIEQILDSSQEFHGDHRSFLLKNLASLRKEKDHWRNFMEKDGTMKTIWEVETEWTKRYINWLFSIYQSAVLSQNDYFAFYCFIVAINMAENLYANTRLRVKLDMMLQQKEP